MAETEKVTVLPSDKMYNSFIDPKYVPVGKDKYYIRNLQVKAPASGWRHLTSKEIEELVKNDNTAMSWDTIMVTDQFDPSMVKNNRFYGYVRIGRITSNGLQYHDLRLPCGITNSSIHSCDIGDDVAIHNVSYLSHYIIGDRCMLFNVQEMSCTDHSKFGNGIVKDGEDSDTRVRIELMNEIGSRYIYPFDGMITADAYFWAKFTDDVKLTDSFAKMTQDMFDSRRGYYGTVGESSVIKNSLIIKDAKIGSNCYIKGGSKIKNVTINSSEQEPTQIGENVILVNGIVGYGCRIFYSCIAVKFVLSSHSNLKYGARLINSFMGENSTISCCEVLNNLIYPAHEQHHNNSFLIACVIKGQSNIAAGATIGSNHNSRTNDNEIEAGRGFWPGLCTSLKHSCKFASFTTISKGDYPNEIINPFPFALLVNNTTSNMLEVIPAFSWLYNMYSLVRNNWKFENRDQRKFKVQNIEFDTFAPDSMEEVMTALALLEKWTGKAMVENQGKNPLDYPEDSLRQIGRDAINNDKELVSSLQIYAEGMEKSSRKTLVKKVTKAYSAYKEMVIHYAVKNIVAYMSDNLNESFNSMADMLEAEPYCHEWLNMGGQIMKSSDVKAMRDGIVSGRISNWKEIHKEYNVIWKRYRTDKLRHAYYCLKEIMGVNDRFSSSDWNMIVNCGIDVQNHMAEQVYLTRKKDYENPFRKSTFRNDDEMNAVVGRLEDNTFIASTNRNTSDFVEKLQNLKNRI